MPVCPLLGLGLAGIAADRELPVCVRRFIPQQEEDVKKAANE
jgi:hypothetical protein